MVRPVWPSGGSGEKDVLYSGVQEGRDWGSREVEAERAKIAMHCSRPKKVA